jgi:hypothetical protein
MRSGEMLHDIEEDISAMRGREDGSAGKGNINDDVDGYAGEARRFSASLLRLLGRINNWKC